MTVVLVCGRRGRTTVTRLGSSQPERRNFLWKLDGSEIMKRVDQTELRSDD